jgi:hypothetical protein
MSRKEINQDSVLKREKNITIFLTVIQVLKAWTGCKWQGGFRVVSLFVHVI